MILMIFAMASLHALTYISHLINAWQSFSKFVIFLRLLVLPDPYVATNPLRLQIIFLKEKTSLHAPTETFWQASCIRLIAVTHCNGWKQAHPC